MSRPKLSSPDQPLAIRWALRLYEFAASLSLAVTLIFGLAFALGLATFVEAAHGTPVVQFYIYQTWWFELLLVLLGVNIFCAAAIRYPWKRHQTGFVITHIGLLTLLFGAYMSRSSGIDAQVSVFEGEMDRWATENAIDLQLTVRKPGQEEGKADRHDIDFRPGLFNWEDWSEEFAFTKPGDENIDGIGRLSWQMFRAGSGALFRLAKQDKPGDVLYDQDGVKLEVLDFYSDSRVVQAPHLKFEISMPTATRATIDGTQKEKQTTWMPAELSVVKRDSLPQYPFGWAQRRRAGGGYFTLQLAGSAAQTDAFLKCVPEGDLGAQGQAVVYAGGQVTRIDVAEKVGQDRFPLEGKSGLEAQVTEYWPAATLGQNGAAFEWQQDKQETKPTNPAVKIALFKEGKQISELVLLALESHSNIVDYRNDVFGAYWFNHGDNGELTKEERTAAQISARIDFLQGTDQKLYYRYWNREKVVFARELPTDGSPEDAVDAFTMPIGTLKLYVKQFIPSDTPTTVAVKQPFVKDRLIGSPMQGGRQPAAKFAMTVDGEREEFWLFPHLATPDVRPTNRADDGERIHFAKNTDRLATLTMPIQSFDIGFRVRLNKFERKLDPGTEQASHYASWVDFVDHAADRAIATLPEGRKKPQLLVSKNIVRPTVLSTGAEDDELIAADERGGLIGGIQRAKLEEKDAKLSAWLDRGVRQPSALVASEQGTVYYVDRVPVGRREMGVIRSVTKDGQTETIAQLKTAPEALALDTKAGVLYFAGRGGDGIGRVTLASGEVDEAWYPSATQPLSLVLDSDNRQLLWCEAGGESIRRVKLDGSDDGLVLARGDDEQPLSLAIDRKNQRLYFMESYANTPADAAGRPTSKPLRWRLMSAKLDGSDVRTECDQGIDEPKSLVMDASNRPLWTQTSLTRDDVWITMNAPVDCFDPQTGRSYRLFQERFSGPFKPGDQISFTQKFEDLVSADALLKNELYESILTVNYDPGRGVRNVGCLLVCLGIAVMFYMRAYFFKKPKSAAVEKSAPRTTTAEEPRREKSQRALAGRR